MKLYGYFRSSAAFRVRIALNLKKLNYESAFIHLRRGDQRQPGFLDINPQGLVPALEVDDTLLIQSLPIIEYLDETYPEPPLLPSDAKGRARVRALAAMVACDIHPINNLRVLRYLLRPLGQDEAAVETWYNHWIAEGFGALERLLAEGGRTGRFCHGDTPGLADIVLVPQVFNANRYQSLDLTPYPTIVRIYQTCLGIDAFAAAHPDRQPDREP
ncbi:MAG: maleylacetoacetate isomerase [Alphaproteobacteria bacterium 13_1_20CM_3_64_12]|jgi:maleylacetoacetate isomerase|nr:MAG: maleylacetoacetate isomerase [Alphaproteobacteria bacterium 13_1_20CM_3_64_12]TMJ76735.1 MAG: maleylacetoacetate isomerase [Alphaproteobacteria bacterium]TMK08124.1 MAG: maleylacetoacetate isomerase [Alphaproteobacteria bacterium]TMK28838.1 MAG: maleylacetoacetate isomerase [Alphaproteobacteria bacterium]